MNFPKEIEEVVQNCSDTAKKLNVEIYLVGGIVRDILLNKDTLDIDITVVSSAIEFVKQLKNAKIKSLHPDFDTAKVVFDNGINVDFASTRRESYPNKGGLPQIENIGVSLKEDVLRRDYTLNSIAMSLNHDSMFKIIDYLGGVEDLNNRLLRVLHQNSFIDDPTRIIRGLEFSLRFDLEFEKNTLNLIKAYLKNPLRDSLSLKRVESALVRLFKLNDPMAFDEFIELELYKIFTDSINIQTDGARIFNAVKNFKPVNYWQVYIDALNSNIEKIKILNNYQAYCAFKGKNEAQLALYYAVTSDTRSMEYYDCLKNIKPILSGEDLIELGYEEGPEIGYALKEILKKKLNGDIATKTSEMDFALKLYESMRGL